MFPGGLYQRHMLHDDDDEEDDEESEFLMQSSAGLLETRLSRLMHRETSSEDENVNPEEYYKQLDEGLRKRFGNGHGGSSTDEDDVDGPDWFNPGPFQHSRRLIIPALMGGAIVLILGGDLLVMVIAIGMLIAYLFHQAGLKESCTNMVVFTTLCCTVVIVFAASPLLWKSAWNITLLVAAFSFTALTGVWCLLMRHDFCCQDPEQTRFLETLLYTMYPVCSLVLVTWLATFSMYGRVGPYVLMVVGYMLIWTTQRPIHSSFCKLDSFEEVCVYVLDSTGAAMLTILYCVSPMLHHCLLMWNSTASFLICILEVLLIFSCTVFLVTFLHLRPILESLGISYTSLQHIRSASVVVAIIMLNFLLHVVDYKSLFLPWWALVFLSVAAGYGYVLATCRKFTSNFYTAVFLVVILGTFFRLPWQLQYTLPATTLDIKTLFLLLVINAMSCVILLFISRYADQEYLGVASVVQGLGVILLKCVLHRSNMISPVLSAGISVFLVLTVLRLYYVRKLQPHHTLPNISLHLASIVTTTVAGSTANGDGSGFFWSLVQFIAVFLFLACFMQALFFERGDMLTMKKVLLYMCGTFFTACLACTCTVCYSQISTTLCLAQYAGFSILATAVVILKLAWFHKCAWTGIRNFGLVTMATGLLLICLKPRISFASNVVAELLAIVSAVCSINIVAQMKRFRSPAILLVAPVLLSLVVWMFISRQTFVDIQGCKPLLLNIICLQISTCVTMVTMAVQQSHQLERQLIYLCYLSFTFSGISVLFEISKPSPDDDADFSIGLLSAAISLIIMASIIKLTSFSALPQTRKQHDNMLPTVGNTAALAGFAVGASSWPGNGLPVELWVIGCSASFFLMRKDKYILTTAVAPMNHSAPTAIATALILVFSALARSLAWHTNSMWTWLVGTLEIFIILFTLPVLITFAVYAWGLETNSFIQRIFPVKCRFYSVIFFLPIYLYLFIIGSSYAATVLAVFGLVAGVWVWKEKFAFFSIF